MVSRISLAVRSCAVFGVALSCVTIAGPARRGESEQPVASLIRFDVPGSDSIFALSVQAGSLGQIVPHDHAVLIDTSASQSGEHRTQALKVLEACLSSLDAADRVSLWAVDVQVQPLTDGYFSPQSVEIRAALDNLSRRVPAGATSLQPALEAALQSFSGARARSIVYLGDGMSTGQLVQQPVLREMLSKLRQQHTPVHSFAVGPQTDLQLLGVLAAHTGGVVIVDALVDDVKLPAEKLGQKLATAVDAPVFFADQLTMTPDVDQWLPGLVLPIRADRETILLGRGTVGASHRVKAVGSGRTLSWTVKPAAAQPGNTFLAGLWNQAEKSDGLLIALAGGELLNLAREDFEDQVQRLLVVGRQAVVTRDLPQAERVAQAVRQMDPANVEAETLLNASQKIKAVQVSRKRMQDDAETLQPPPAGITDDDEPATAKSTALLDEQRTFQKLRAEKLNKEVARTIDATNKVGASDPELALQQLKRTLNSVVSSTDVDADVREKLRSRVVSSIERLTGAINKLELDRISAMEMASAVKARELATEQLVQRDEQLEQLISKVSSLLYEGYIGNANAFERAEEVARASFELAPYSGVTSSAIFASEAAGQLDKSVRLKYRRYDMFLATMYQVEMAHIPFPDEPPIVYPAPEVWKSLTERRRKWASVDLLRWNPAEEKIRRSFDKPTNVEWQELALEDCITYLAEFHGINIILDKVKLTEEGVALDQPITLKLQGVSLRSVMKLLLEPVQLTYIIENEVMKITTSQSAADKLSTRVYPVGDLVIPIITPRAGGGGMGMMGGMGGGGGGGMGGGMMGGGGGGMGGGGMGGGMGGGGMMNIPDPASR